MLYRVNVCIDIQFMNKERESGGIFIWFVSRQEVLTWSNFCSFKKKHVDGFIQNEALNFRRYRTKQINTIDLKKTTTIHSLHSFFYSELLPSRVFLHSAKLAGEMTVFSFARQHTSDRRWARVKWLLKYPSLQITSLLVLIPSFELIKLYAPAQLSRRLLMSFHLQR